MNSAGGFPELADFVSAVRASYGSRLHGIYLFGSRARGDHRADSDFDVAVVLRELTGPLWQEQDRLADLAYETLLSTGMHIQPVPFSLDEWQAPGTPRDLLRAVKRDGQPLAELA